MDYRIETRYKAEFYCDSDFRKTLYEMSFAAYEITEDIINYSIGRNDTVYCALDTEGKIIGVLFTNWGEKPLISDNGKLLEVVYVGWGIVMPSFQGKGVFRELLKFLQAGVRTHTQQLQQPVCLYARTALSTVYKTLKKIFPNLQPEPDGRFSEEISPVVDALLSLWSKTIDKVHPFRLSGAARYRYSKLQIIENQKVSDSYPVTLFESLSIDESNGDRLLMAIPIAV